MTFEEFFRKKKIDLHQLQTADGVLFAEFQSHYAQMGEKSFDHTKKYWFNSLRRKYHLADEPKVEKIRMENQIAEQTITESITEHTNPVAPKPGFTPRFKAPVIPVAKPEETPDAIPEQSQEPTATPETLAPKLGFKPKFKTAAATSESTAGADDKPTDPVKEIEVSAPKLGFKPKFKAASVVTDISAENTPTPVQEEKVEPVSDDAPALKLGFKPKFKSAVKPAAEVEAEAPVTDNNPPVTAEPEADKTETKPAYKPKFQAKNFKPKTDEE